MYRENGRFASNTTPRDRFWSKVHETNGCWVWLASTNSDGYGLFWIGTRIEHSHRMAWVFTNGPIPTRMCVLHRCDNPSCCNPEHLFLGTHADNMRDMANKGRGVGASQPGPCNPMAKLTWGKVRMMRAMQASDRYQTQELADIFKVDSGHIRNIICGHRWKQRDAAKETT